MWCVMRRTLLFRAIMILGLTVDFGSASADVVDLKGGEQLGGPDSFLYLEKKEKLVIVDPSGERTAITLDDIASMRLDGPRKIELKNGDVLHVADIRLQEGELRFTSELLGEIAVPLDAVVSISPPASEEVAEIPAPVEPEAPAVVEPETPKPPKKWEGNVQFGYASTSGRQDTQNANVSAEAVRESAKTRLTLNAAARYGETDGEKNVDAQEASGKFDLFFTDRVYLYWDVGVLRDSINLIDLRLSPGVGVGRKLITGNRFSLEGEAGTTMIWERQSLTSGEKETESNWYGRVAGRFKWKLGEGAEFSEELEVLPGLSSSDEFRYRSVSQITATLTKRLSLVAGFTVDYDNNPPEDVPKTSTNANTGFILNF